MMLDWGIPRSQIIGFSGSVVLRWTSINLKICNRKGSVITTGETINLVEIAYGIWLTGQVNNGNASISEIVLWLERHFEVRVGKAHRRWQNIAGRKRLAPFRYMDEMKEALVKRLEEEWGK